MARKREEEHAGINMTPMIDIVFQMIIFFVLTVDLDKKQFDERITLAMAPHGQAVTAKDPRTVYVDVHANGMISVAHQKHSLLSFQYMMNNAVGKHGQNVPVVIRGDQNTRHEDIRMVMDACSRAGLWKVSFAALKERAKNQP